VPDYVTYPGTALMVSVARASLTILVGPSPRRGDIETVVSEFATNAVLHSRSGEDGGEFALGVDRKIGWARVEILDQGPKAKVHAPAAPPPETELDDSPPADHGHGLLIVAAYADRWGQDAQPGVGTWWAEFSWDEERADA
jgi:anti-sigma regulatory factor (Ser/Thr protein kinase)